MTWRDDLRRVTITIDGKQRDLIGASYRGVPFLVDASDLTVGRRVETHEFPFRSSYTEDMGPKTRVGKIDGYVLGADYIAQRDKLIDAIELEGPGQLLHPFYGMRVGIAHTANIRESKADGGIAIVSIEFTETPKQAPTPTVVDDPAGKVSASADAAQAATAKEFGEKFDSSGMPGFALASAEAAIQSAAAAMKDQLGPVIADTQEAAQLAQQVALLTAEAASLVRTPALIVGNFQTALGNLFNTVLAAPGALMNAYLGAYFVDLGPTVTGTTATRERELANQTALTSALRRVFAIEAARLAPKVAFASVDDATAARDQIRAVLDEQAALADDTAYPAIVDLRSKVLQAVPGRQRFARINIVTRSVPIPSILLAYQIYGNVDNELDIVARNGVRHPGFVSGALKVLSDG